MKSCAILGIAALLATAGWGIQVPGADSVAAVESPDLSRPNALYPGNRPPLLPSPFVKLPVGAVKPLGWLRRQLELEAGGFTGHLTEISGFCRPADNAWLSAEGKGHSGWEEVPYWFRGFRSGSASATRISPGADLASWGTWMRSAGMGMRSARPKWRTCSGPRGREIAIRRQRGTASARH